ncbi:hypothetical protein, partial [Streptomyces griseorubiginosus]|uniref:hypothetical protein n=1 Tax=Streptomyces griseorubiginosus TaxID=67304 RepID=UPI001AD70499
AGGGQGGNERVRNSGARGSIGTSGRGNRSRRRAAEEELYEEEEAAFTPGMPYGTTPGAGTRPERTATESGDRERSAWVQEDEDVWGTEEGTTPAVIGR